MFFESRFLFNLFLSRFVSHIFLVMLYELGYKNMKKKCFIFGNTNWLNKKHFHIEIPLKKNLKYFMWMIAY